MKRGDRVKLKEHVAALRMRRRQNTRNFDWRLRVGSIHHIRKYQPVVEVLWDGRGSVEPMPIIALELVES